MSAAASHWDAEVYERNSDPQLTWGLEVLDRLALRGDESVLDAGCGSGALTRALVERLPGKAAAAIAEARSTRSDGSSPSWPSAIAPTSTDRDDACRPARPGVSPRP